MVRVRINRRQGVSAWIEHMDGSEICEPGDWVACMVKPYPKKREDRETFKLIERWNVGGIMTEPKLLTLPCDP